MSKAILHPASIWDCDHCGTSNVERIMRIQLDPSRDDHLDEIIKVYGEVEEGVAQYGYAIRESVTCKHCGKNYEAILVEQEEEDA